MFRCTDIQIARTDGEGARSKSFPHPLLFASYLLHFYRDICYDIDHNRWNKIIQMKRRSPQNTIRNELSTAWDGYASVVPFDGSTHELLQTVVKVGQLVESKVVKNNSRAIDRFIVWAY